MTNRSEQFVNLVFNCFVQVAKSFFLNDLRKRKWFCSIEWILNNEEDHFENRHFFYSSRLNMKILIVSILFGTLVDFAEQELKDLGG